MNSNFISLPVRDAAEFVSGDGDRCKESEDPETTRQLTALFMRF